MTCFMQDTPTRAIVSCDWAEHSISTSSSCFSASTAELGRRSVPDALPPGGSSPVCGVLRYFPSLPAALVAARADEGDGVDCPSSDSLPITTRSPSVSSVCDLARKSTTRSELTYLPCLILIDRVRRKVQPVRLCLTLAKLLIGRLLALSDARRIAHLNRSCSSWVTCRQTEKTGSQQSALCEPSSNPPDSTTSIDSAWLAGILGPAFWHTFEAIRLIIFPARCCRLSALLSVAAACSPSRLRAYSVSPEPRVSLRTRSVFFDSFTSRAVGDPSASPSPAVSTATIESQQHVSSRRAILRAARCFAVGSVCTRTTDCSRCQSDSIWVGPVPPASCSISSKAQWVLAAGSFARWVARLQRVARQYALVQLAEPRRRQVHQYAGVLHRGDELLLGERNGGWLWAVRVNAAAVIVVVTAGDELQGEQERRSPSPRVALLRWQTRDANSCTASSISIEVLRRSSDGTSSLASTAANSRACCRSQSPSERPLEPESSMCAHSQLPWLALDDTSSPDECVSSSGPSVSPEPTEPSSGSIVPCSSGPSASDSDDDSNPLWRSSATASRYGGGKRVID
uniref:Uncharacterized protein n=1 Tax=Anopheles coluzzii TaxID=1518534 RepID=A0A8W7PQY2_ANOCL